MHHDLFEEIDWGCFDGPGEAELAQMGTGVARQGFAGVKQLAAEITEDCWWGLYLQESSRLCERRSGAESGSVRRT